jgi:carboxymethylenebutenolidase
MPRPDLDPLSIGRALLVAVLLLPGVWACAGGDTPEGEPPPSDGAVTPPPAAADEGRVPLARTATDELPPALRGEAGPLLGIDVHYLPGDSATMGYLAVPEGDGPFPALVLVHEWNGLDERVRRIADDLAAEGYVALAADLFGGRSGGSPDENRALVAEAQSEPEVIIANLDAAVAHLRARPDVTGRVGALGWCFGGGIALSFGLDGVSHEATAIFYGRLVDDPATLAGLSHEVYGTFAELDDGIPPEAVASFVEALRAAGIDNDVHVYDDVSHGFWLRADQDPGARNAPALDAWQRLKAYLERTLGS